MGRTTAQVAVDTFACDAAKCEVAHTVRPGEVPSGFRVILHPAMLAGLDMSAVDEDEREVYSCRQGHIGQAVVARAQALMARLEGDQDGGDGGEVADQDDEPSDDEPEEDPRDDEPTAADDGWDDEMSGEVAERAAAGA